MRFLLKASWTVEAGNALAKKGALGATVASILAEIKPEAAYFLADEGKRTAYLIVNMDDASEIPAMAKPWFLACDASVEFQPVMLAGDLEKAGPAIAEAARKYG